MDRLRPLVAHCRRQMQLYGKDYPGKPVRPLAVYTLTSIVREPVGILCLISTNDGIQSFTQALYHLASPPEDIQPLREEIEVYYHNL